MDRHGNKENHGDFNYLDKSLKVVPIVLPLPLLEAMVRQVEYNDLPPRLKDEVTHMLHVLLEASKVAAVYSHEISPQDIQNAVNNAVGNQAPFPDVSFDDLVEWISQRTKIDDKIVKEVLEAEEDFFFENFGQ